MVAEVMVYLPAPPVQGQAQTQSPIATNYMVKFPTWRKTTGVSTGRVHGMSLSSWKSHHLTVSAETTMHCSTQRNGYSTVLPNLLVTIFLDPVFL